jgi:hypothetical protein
LVGNEALQTASWRGSLKGHYLLIVYWVFPIVAGSLLLGLDARSIEFWTGIVLLLEGLFSFLLLGSQYVQRLSCTISELRYPKGFFRHGTIPIRDISGIGLVWSRRKLDRTHVYGKGWALTIWRHGVESPVRFPQFLDLSKVVGYQYPRKKRVTEMPLDLPSEKVEWEDLAGSRVAQIAKRIYDLAGAEQGPLGCLTTEAVQLAYSMQTPWRGPLYIHAIWSPDGHFRRADIERAQAEVHSEPGSSLT